MSLESQHQPVLTLFRRAVTDAKCCTNIRFSLYESLLKGWRRRSGWCHVLLNCWWKYYHEIMTSLRSCVEDVQKLVQNKLLTVLNSRRWPTKAVGNIHEYVSRSSITFILIFLRNGAASAPTEPHSFPFSPGDRWAAACSYIFSCP
jgi:hypothetical protein